MDQRRIVERAGADAHFADNRWFRVDRNPAVVDTGLLREIRATAQQAAEELGQWKSDAEATAADRGRVVIALPDQAEQELKPQNADALTAAGKRIPV